MSHQLCMILDFGGQYNQLIARRVRECGVYCEVFSYKTPIEKIKKLKPAGIIFTGGPNSVYAENSPQIDKEIFEWYPCFRYLIWLSANGTNAWWQGCDCNNA